MPVLQQGPAQLAEGQLMGSPELWQGRLRDPEERPLDVVDVEVAILHHCGRAIPEAPVVLESLLDVRPAAEDGVQTQEVAHLCAEAHVHVTRGTHGAARSVPLLHRLPDSQILQDVTVARQCRQQLLPTAVPALRPAREEVPGRGAGVRHLKALERRDQLGLRCPRGPHEVGQMAAQPILRLPLHRRGLLPPGRAMPVRSIHMDRRQRCVPLLQRAPGLRLVLRVRCPEGCGPGDIISARLPEAAILHLDDSATDGTVVVGEAVDGHYVVCGMC